MPYTDPRARGYRTTIEVDAARNWIRERDGKTPWMATVSFSADHVPFQPAPPSFLLPGAPDPANPDCTNSAALRTLSNQTIEALDQELGRLLVELGIAGRNANGDLVYDPASSNTMIVIVGDNGTYAPVVKEPFDPLHSKGTPYQTGAWVPLIVAGPLVSQPDREVTHMVNLADLFALFGEIAKVDVRRAVPRSHTLDAVAMLPYLTNPAQKSLRATNFTQGGTNFTANNVQDPPCAVPVEGSNTCSQLFPNQAICQSEGGVWYGPGSPTPYANCCEVQKNVYASDPSALRILPTASWAIRNDRFKLLQKDEPDCSSSDPNAVTRVTEFYEVNELPVFPLIERPEGDFLPYNNLLPYGADPESLPPVQKANFYALQSQLQALFQSEVACPGDGNLDKVVNGKDIALWRYFKSISGGGSSWYDFPQNGVYDGTTDDGDLKVILENLGTHCLRDR